MRPFVPLLIRSLLLCLMGLYPLLLSAQSNLVSRKAKREKTLEIAERVLDSAAPDFRDLLAEVINPFEPFYEAPPTPEPGEDPELVRIVPSTESELPDETVLQLVAQRLKPTGSLVAGSRKILLFPKGMRLVPGDVVPVRIKSYTYEVIIEDITAGGYTLKLNQAELPQTFLKARSAGSIKFDSQK